jgi:hypothetical protein
VTFAQTWLFPGEAFPFGFPRFDLAAVVWFCLRLFDLDPAFRVKVVADAFDQILARPLRL